MATDTQAKGQSSGSGSQSLEGIWGSVQDLAAKNPAVEKLLDAVKSYASAQAGKAMGSVGEKAGGFTQKLTDFAEGNIDGGGLLGKGAEKVAQGDDPAKAALKAGGEQLKEKVKGVFSRGKSSGNQKVINIIEDINVGVPARVAYDQWTQFQEFGKFMKGVESVEATEETKSTWRVKIAFSKRSFTSTVTEQIPDQRIAWSSEGQKGSTKGVVTFHPLGDNLTKVLLVIEYYPTGFFEKTGNIWRAAGRRARLDLKHYRRFVMTQGEATGSYRGEIRDGEVVRTHDEVTEEEERQNQQDSADDQSPDSEDYYDDDVEDEYDDEYDDDEDEYDDESDEVEDDIDEPEEEPEDEPEEEPRRTSRKKRSRRETVNA
jgi:uncharacterized membrane protein